MFVTDSVKQLIDLRHDADNRTCVFANAHELCYSHQQIVHPDVQRTIANGIKKGDKPPFVL